MKHEYSINLKNGWVIEFMPPWLFLLSWRDPFEFKFCLHFPEQAYLDKGDAVLDFDMTLFNFELIGLYADAFKIHVGLLGFAFNVWYKQKRG